MRESSRYDRDNLPCVEVRISCSKGSETAAAKDASTCNVEVLRVNLVSGKSPN